MEVQEEEDSEEITFLREQRRQLCDTIGSQRCVREEFMRGLSSEVPEIVISVEISLRVATTFGGLPAKKRDWPENRSIPRADMRVVDCTRGNEDNKGVVGRRSLNSGFEIRQFNRGLLRSNEENENPFGRRGESWSFGKGPENWTLKEGGPLEALTFVKGIVAACLLAPNTSIPIDSTGLHRRLSKEATAGEKDALAELGGQGGGIQAVEKALKALAECTNGGMEVEEFAVSGKSRLMVLGIDRNRLSKEILGPALELRVVGDQGGPPPPHMRGIVMPPPGGGLDPNGVPINLNLGPPGHLRPDMWGVGNDTHLQVGPGPMAGAGLPMFPSPAGPPPGSGPRGIRGLMGLPGQPGLGVIFGGLPGHFQRPSLAQQGLGGGLPGVVGRNRGGDDDEMKDLEALLNKKSFRELQQSKTGEELLELLHRPTAKETAVAAKFKTKGGSALKEYCPALTKEDCRRQRDSFVACEKVHFRRIIAPHTDSNLGDCSFLDTCRHMKTCKYVHYELDPTQDVRGIMVGVPGLSPPATLPLKLRRAEYCSDAELGEAQWINCDIRSFRMDVLGQFGVIMADPPWDIHMELPYGTMADDEMRNLNVPVLQTDGLIYLWVTGRAMELGRECLELWGYHRVEEMIWVKTNQLQRIIRTGRTGHWLNHSKEHCLVGIKGNPELNRNIDTDVIVAEVRETSRKPDEMYPLLERISPRTRKLELFARMHNTHAGWISLGNQLNGVRLVDEALRARFRNTYPDLEVQPPDPPTKDSEQDVDTSSTSKNTIPVGPVEKETVELSTALATVANWGNVGGDEKIESEKEMESLVR